MGSTIVSWDTFEKGAMYLGAGTSWEAIWLILSIVLCIIALVAGSRHEKAAYRKIGKK